jgi:hypothetical protein
MSKNVARNPKIVLEWKKPLGDKNKPYAYRWRVDFYWFSFRIHKWICSDDERAYHSHPINMIILILSGWYNDVRLDKFNNRYTTAYYPFSIHRIKRDTRHYVRIMKSPTWTILFTWGVPKRWYFWLRSNLKRKARDRYFIEHGNHICDD